MNYLIVVDHGWGEVGTYEYDKITEEMLKLLEEAQTDVRYFVSYKEEIDINTFLKEHYNKKQNLVESALAKLTILEREALGF